MVTVIDDGKPISEAVRSMLLEVSGEKERLHRNSRQMAPVGDGVGHESIDKGTFDENGRGKRLRELLQSVLYVAVENGDYAGVKEAIAQGAKVNYSTSRGSEAIGYAKTPEMVLYLAEFVKPEVPYGASRALVNVCWNSDDRGMVEALLRAGANPFSEKCIVGAYYDIRAGPLSALEAAEQKDARNSLELIGGWLHKSIRRKNGELHSTSDDVKELQKKEKALGDKITDMRMAEARIDRILGDQAQRANTSLRKTEAARATGGKDAHGSATRTPA